MTGPERLTLDHVLDLLRDFRQETKDGIEDLSTRVRSLEDAKTAQDAIAEATKVTAEATATVRDAHSKRRRERIAIFAAVATGAGSLIVNIINALPR